MSENVGSSGIMVPLTQKMSDEERVYPADWSTHGKRAGPIRNRLMLTNESPHVMIAFKGGKGTAHMVTIGKKAGVPVHEVQ